MVEDQIFQDEAWHKLYCLAKYLSRDHVSDYPKKVICLLVKRCHLKILLTHQVASSKLFLFSSLCFQWKPFIHSPKHFKRKLRKIELGRHQGRTQVLFKYLLVVRTKIREVLMFFCCLTLELNRRADLSTLIYSSPIISDRCITLVSIEFPLLQILYDRVDQ